MLARIVLATAHPRSPEFDRSIGRLEHLRASALADERIGNLIEILAVLALTRHRRRELDEAHAALEEALRLGAPEGYVRVFLDDGPPMIGLLEHCARGGSSEASTSATQFARAILHTVAGGTAASANRRTLVELLGARELEVLHLMAGGVSNAGIARELVIGNATVKTHVNRIFRKLEVSSRTQAIVRARALGSLAQSA